MIWSFCQFWPFLMISDQFLLISVSILKQILAVFADFCRNLQFLRDFCTFWPIPASLCRAREHGLGWPLPREAAPLKNPRNTNDFAMLREGQAGPAGLGPFAASAGRCSFSGQNLQFLADFCRFCIFLHILAHFWSKICSISAHFWSFSWNSINFDAIPSNNDKKLIISIIN